TMARSEPSAGGSNVSRRQRRPYSAAADLSHLGIPDSGGILSRSTRRSCRALAARGESLASHRDERGAPMARRDDREYRAIFEGGATQPAGMHRRPNAAGLAPRAARPP